MPNDADASLLIHKIEPDHPMLCESPMPIGAPLSAEQVTIVRQWIEAGAMND